MVLIGGRDRPRRERRARPGHRHRPARAAARGRAAGRAGLHLEQRHHLPRALRPAAAGRRRDRPRAGRARLRGPGDRPLPGGRRGPGHRASRWAASRSPAPRPWRSASSLAFLLVGPLGPPRHRPHRAPARPRAAPAGRAGDRASAGARSARRPGCRRRSGRCWPASCCRAARCATRSSSSSSACATSRRRSSSSPSAWRWTSAPPATPPSGWSSRCPIADRRQARRRLPRRAAHRLHPPPEHQRGRRPGRPRRVHDHPGRPRGGRGGPRFGLPRPGGPFAGLFVLATAVAGVVLMRESRRIGRIAFPSRAARRGSRR